MEYRHRQQPNDVDPKSAADANDRSRPAWAPVGKRWTRRSLPKSTALMPPEGAVEAKRRRAVLAAVRCVCARRAAPGMQPRLSPYPKLSFNWWPTAKPLHSRTFAMKPFEISLKSLRPAIAAAAPSRTTRLQLSLLGPPYIMAGLGNGLGLFDVCRRWTCWQPCGMSAAVWRRRYFFMPGAGSRFCTFCLKALILLVSFSAAYATLTYAVALARARRGPMPDWRESARRRVCRPAMSSAGPQNIRPSKLA